MTGEKLALSRSYRNDIRCYCNLPKTNLTDLKWQFIESRLAEEQSVMEKVMASTFPLALDRQSYRSMGPRSQGGPPCWK
jgi:hypothetical protein